MTSYRIYVLSPQDRIADLIEAVFETDVAALRLAESLLGRGYAAEVWRGDRLVARIGGQLQLARA